MIVSIYAALLAMLFIFMSLRIIKIRRRLKIAIGDDGNEQLQRAMRVHANFSEYVPLSLILALLVELSNGHNVIVHIICLCLLLGRYIHAYGVSQTEETFRFRILGMQLTFASLTISCVSLIILQIINF